MYPCPRNRDQQGQSGGSENCPRPILTGKCLGALTGKMLPRASISVFNTVRTVGKAHSPIYNLGKGRVAVSGLLLKHL